MLAMARPLADQQWSRRRFLVTVGGAAATGLVLGTGLVGLSGRPAATGTPGPAGTDAVARVTPSPTQSAVASAPTPTPNATPSLAFHTSGIKGVALPLDQRYFSHQAILSQHPSWPIDRDGVPVVPPDQTLNGFQFATFGLYDYDQAVHEADSAAILDGALTTVKHYLPAYRHPADVSYYCLAHHVISEHYHDIVIRQLSKVAQMTGDPDFDAAANQLRADHP